MEINMKAELRDWLTKQKWDIGATLTFAHDVTPEFASKAIGRFWNRVDKNLYNNAAYRYNKRCQRVMFIEGSEYGTRYHYHAAIKMPQDRFDEADRFCQFLRKQWRAECYQNKIIEFKPTQNSNRLINYITKHIHSFDCDTFDVNTSHITITDPLNSI